MAIIAEFASELGCETPLFTTTQPVYAPGNGDGIGQSRYGRRVRSAEGKRRLTDDDPAFVMGRLPPGYPNNGSPSRRRFALQLIDGDLWRLQVFDAWPPG